MSLWDRLRGRGAASSSAREAKQLEAEGALAAAAEAYERAGLVDDAARVLLTSIDAEPSLERRLALCDRAARLAQGEELKKRAGARRARMALDLLRPRASVARSELARVAEQLELADDHELAAEAWALAGDRDGEIRALTAAGAIDALEARLADDVERAKRVEERARLARQVEDLDRVGERLRALELVDEATAEHRDEALDELARRLRTRLSRGPRWSVSVDGEKLWIAFGASVILGRGEVTVPVVSRALSREHLRIDRDANGAPRVTDLGSRNGTLLAGGRLGAPVPVGAGLELRLGGEVPAEVVPDPRGGVMIRVAGRDYVAPLGPANLAGWQLDLFDAPPSLGGPPLVVLESSAACPAFFGRYQASPRIELSTGDAIAQERGGSARLVVGSSAEVDP